nr:hypothetical protein [uncultured Rhodopila sp.]
MSDDSIRSALARLEAGQAKLEAEQEPLREQLNTKLDDILDKMSAIRQETDTVRGHVVYGLPGNLTLSQRLTKIEEEMRKR